MKNIQKQKKNWRKEKKEALKEILRGVCEKNKKFRNIEVLRAFGDEILERAIFELGQEFGQEEKEADQITTALKESQPMLVKIFEGAKTTLGRILRINLNKDTAPSAKLVEITEKLGIFTGAASKRIEAKIKRQGKEEGEEEKGWKGNL